MRSLIAFFALSTVALSIWGIPETLIQTDSQINTFWDILYDIRDAQANTTAELAVLNAQLEILETSVQQISNETSRLKDILRPLGSIGAAVAEGLTLIEEAAKGVATVQQAIREAIRALERYVGGVSINV